MLVFITMTQKKGFSLVEMLVAIAILAVITTGLMTAMNQLFSEQKNFGQKMDTFELRYLLTTVMSDPFNCTWQFQNGNPTIDLSGASPTTPSPSEIILTQLRAGYDSSSLLLAEAGSPLPTSQTNIKVSTIKFRKIYCLDNPCANRVKGVLEIAFDPATLARPRAPVELNMFMTTVATDPASQKKIEACGLMIAPAGNAGSLCGAGSVEGVAQGPGSLCNGVNPASGCPIGYTRSPIGLDSGNGVRTFYSCVKN
jgi:prepilin-type N-terminal cleavage/methylation domain-containing protein